MTVFSTILNAAKKKSIDFLFHQHEAAVEAPPPELAKTQVLLPLGITQYPTDAIEARETLFQIIGFSDADTTSVEFNVGRLSETFVKVEIHVNHQFWTEIHGTVGDQFRIYGGRVAILNVTAASVLLRFEQEAP